MSNRTLGYIILWQVPEVDIRYTELAELAQSAGLPASYVPKAPKPRGAWEKATNLGSTGLKLELSPAIVEAVKKEYGKEPVCKLYTKIISSAAPLLIRHIVREVTIPFSDDESIMEKVRKQYSPQTVAYLEYDTTEETSPRAFGPESLPDPSGYVNGNVKEVVRELLDKVDRYLYRADGSRIADSIRQFLTDKAATLMSAGGAYFLPYDDNLYQSLKALKVWVELLADYRVDLTHRKPQFAIFPITDSDEATDAILDIAQNAEKQLSENVEELISDLAPLLDGNRTAKVAGNIRSRVNERYMELQSNVNKYKVALNDSLPRLDALLDKAAELIRVAMAVDTYRAPRRKEEVVTVETGAVIERGQRVMGGVEVEAVEVTRRGKRVA